MTTTPTLIDRLSAIPADALDRVLGGALSRHAPAMSDADRAAIQKQMDALEAKKAKELPKLQAATAKARDKAEATRAAADVAEVEHRQTKAQETRLAASIDSQRRRLESDLRRGAPAVIAETHDKVRQEIEQTRRTQVQTRSKRSRSFAGLLEWQTTHSSLASLRRRLDYLRDASRELVEEVPLLESRNAIEKRCAAILANVPPVTIEKVR